MTDAAQLRELAERVNRIATHPDLNNNERMDLHAAADALGRQVPREQFRHVKSGRIYTKLMYVLREADKQMMVVYEATDGERWARPLNEWQERFAALPPAPGAADGD